MTTVARSPMAGGKGGKAATKSSSSDVEDGAEGLDDIAGVPETKARFDRVLEVEWPVVRIGGLWGRKAGIMQTWI